MIMKNENSCLWRGILDTEWSGQTIGPLGQILVKHIRYQPGYLFGNQSKSQQQFYEITTST
jgi:hypothetical protein